MKKSRSISVLIADDHTVVREGLVSIIKHELGLQLVPEASSWPQAIEGTALHHPELAILDLHMPGMEASDAIPVIREKSPETRLIVLTAFGGDEDVFQAAHAGVNGYLPKDAGKEALLECIRAAREGKTWIHPDAASKLADRVQKPEMTSRELEVLMLVAGGKSNKEIGQLLGVTEGTVKVHVNHLFAKLGVDGRVAATMLALERGIVHLPTGRGPARSNSAPKVKKFAS